LIGLPYLQIVLMACLLIAFCKIGELDREIGRLMGLLAGILVVGASLLFPGGYLRLILYALGGFALLTAYKLARGAVREKASNREENTGPDGPKGPDTPQQ